MRKGTKPVEVSSREAETLCVTHISRLPDPKHPLMNEETKPVEVSSRDAELPCVTHKSRPPDPKHPPFIETMPSKCFQDCAWPQSRLGISLPFSDLEEVPKAQPMRSRR